jgi:hypothetical protein
LLTFGLLLGAGLAVAFLAGFAGLTGFLAAGLALPAAALFFAIFVFAIVDTLLQFRQMSSLPG